LKIAIFSSGIIESWNKSAEIPHPAHRCFVAISVVHIALQLKQKPIEAFRKAHEKALRATDIEARQIAQLEGISDPTKRSAAIKNNRISFHTLRHTFATRLMA